MIEEVKEEIEMIEKQVNGFIIPLYNHYKEGKEMHYTNPDEFTMTISRKILEKMIQLNNKID